MPRVQGQCGLESRSARDTKLKLDKKTKKEPNRVSFLTYEEADTILRHTILTHIT